MRYDHILAGAAVALMLTGFSPSTQAEQRTGTVTGPHGTSTFTENRTTANGVTTTNATITKPDGKTEQRVTTRTPQANGTVAVQTTITKPNGRVVSRSRTR
jgi:hypothetical protein